MRPPLVLAGQARCPVGLALAALVLGGGGKLTLVASTVSGNGGCLASATGAASTTKRPQSSDAGMGTEPAAVPRLRGRGLGGVCLRGRDPVLLDDHPAPIAASAKVSAEGLEVDVAGTELAEDTAAPRLGPA